MGRRKKTKMEESLIKNNANFNMYLDRLRELSLAMFEYKRLPDTVDERYIEFLVSCAKLERESKEKFNYFLKND